tara:strand:+ start:672 stop:1229 length:558 start_codon:yes stop_codon:yes gene_type:complete
MNSLNCIFESRMVSRPAFFHQMTFEDDDVLNNLKIKIKKNVSESRKYTNVKAAMTDWRHFNKDEDFVKIATSLTQNLAYNGLGFFKNMDQNEYKIEVVESWGILYKKGDETVRHAHQGFQFTSCLYFSNDSILDTDLKKFCTYKGLLLTLPGWVEHCVSKKQTEEERFVLVFNWNIPNHWEEERQ